MSSFLITNFSKASTSTQKQSCIQYHHTAHISNFKTSIK